MDVSNLGQLGGGPALDFDDVQPTEKKKKSKKKDDEVAANDSSLIHIRVQQRNGRKCITTIQGLDAQLDLKKILKAIKKAECCNGTVVTDDDMGEVLQFQGDQRDAVAKFLVENGAPPIAPPAVVPACRPASPRSPFLYINAGHGCCVAAAAAEGWRNCRSGVRTASLFS